MRTRILLLIAFLISVAACSPAARQKDAPAYHNPTVQPLTDAINQDPADASLFFHRSEALMRVNEPGLARKDLLAAIRMDSLNPTYIQALGIMALQQSQPAEAIAAFRRSLKIVPGEARVRLLLSQAYLLQNDIPSAQREVTQVLYAAPDFPGAHYMQAQIEVAKRDTASAIALLKKCLVDDPHDYQAAGQLGDWLSQTHDPRAVDQFLLTFAMDTTNVKPLWNIGKFYENQGKTDQAQAAYYECVLRDPNYTDAFLEMGKILYRRDSIAKALRQFNLAIKTQPNSAEAYFQKGLCFERLHQKDSARLAFGQALVFRSDYQQAKAGLKRVKQNDY